MSAASGALDAAVLEAAVHWYVQLRDARPGDARHEACRAWIAARPEHRHAWARVQALGERLRGLPVDLALSALAGADAGRRAALKTLLVLAAVGPAAWVGYHQLPWRSWSAQERTGTGQRRTLSLADGSRVELNTATALDVAFSGEQRLLRLYGGELLVATAVDALHRPFLVHTPQGAIRALGTRFSVRTGAGRTRVGVLEHAVEIHPADSRDPPMRLTAGQQLEFTAARAGTPAALDPNSTAWTRGMLIVIDWRLQDFIAELARYHPGHLGCDPAVADLRVSGAFRLDDLDGALDNLAASLPVRVQSLSHYWVRVVAH